ncbi:MAG: 30S ribosomal protein S16 [Phycisphaerales bacterium]|jgi:small subunit ribosomal protein S16|nr:30S ribosomal protein S16 [Phycisphaerales bacterium]
MVVIRMQRMGRAHRPFYRIGVMDKRSPRNGRVIENLGWYDPVHTMGKDKPEYQINEDRTRYWLSVGAQPSDTVRDLLRKAEIDAKPGTAYVAAPMEAAEAAEAAAE